MAGAPPHCLGHIRIGGECGNRVREQIILPDEPGFALTHYVGRPTIRGHDARDTRGQRFQHGVAECIGVRWKDKCIHIGIGTGERLAMQYSGELSVSQPFSKPDLLASLANDQEAEAPSCNQSPQLLLNRYQEGYILLSRQASHETQNKVSIICGPRTVRR